MVSHWSLQNSVAGFDSLHPRNGSDGCKGTID